jgi:hypothetical protein
MVGSFQRERLFQHRDVRLQHPVMRDIVIDVAGGVEHFHRRPPREEPLRQRRAAQPGHDHVGQQQVDDPRVFRFRLEPAVACACAAETPAVRTMTTNSAGSARMTVHHTALNSGMRRAAVVVLTLVTAATAQAQIARYVDRTRLMREVSALADPKFEGRRAGSPGGVRARQWIVAEFGRLGLAPAGTSGFLQPFTATDRNTRLAAANVIGRIAGRSRLRTIVVTAHYDHDGIRNGVIYPGADDNASGVAVLLAAASHFLAEPPRHPMIFAALDAEEIGQQGARAFVQANVVPRGEIALNVNLDMVSRSTRNQLYASGTFHSPWLKPIVEEMKGRSGVEIVFGHDLPGTGRDDWTSQSDHVEFHKAGIPHIYFGVEDHPDYHRPTDTADRIDPRFFGDAADAIVEAVRTLDARLP